MANPVFDTWLLGQLQHKSLDEDIYFEYIKGILEEETGDELKEAVLEILSGVLEEDVDSFAEDICKKWNESCNNSDSEKQLDNMVNAEDKIKSLIEQQQAQAMVAEKKSNKLVDNELKKLVLSQYQNSAVGSDDENGRSDNENDGSLSSEFKNTNAVAVVEKQQQEREKQKKVSEEKRQRDKLNREKEKQKKEDRQEKEKKRTQKGERGGR